MFLICEDVMLEAFEPGADLRVILIDYEVVAAAVRRPAEITGNGQRCHEDSLTALGQLLRLYLQSKPTFKRDREDLGGLEGFPTLPVEIGGKH